MKICTCICLDMAITDIYSRKTYTERVIGSLLCPHVFSSCTFPPGFATVSFPLALAFLYTPRLCIMHNSSLCPPALVIIYRPLQLFLAMLGGLHCLSSLGHSHSCVPMRRPSTSMWPPLDGTTACFQSRPRWSWRGGGSRWRLIWHWQSCQVTAGELCALSDTHCCPCSEPCHALS
jgi:hypothetical protein